MAGYGRMLLEARDRRGWTQDEVGSRVGVSASTLSRWENELGPPEIKYIDKLVLALGLSPEELLQAMGISMTPTLAARLPRELVLDLLAAPPEIRAAVQLLLAGWRDEQHRHTEQAQGSRPIPLVDRARGHSQQV